MLILDCLRLFFLENCPLFSEKGMRINYLPDIPYTFSLNLVSVNPIVKKYADGGDLRQFVFTFAMHNFYDCEEENSMHTIANFEYLANWIEQANNNNLLPELFNGFTPVSLSVISTVHQKSHKAAKAVYEIKCKLLYERKEALTIWED
ncbi:MAG: hypothetical protein IKU87_02445 [Clostridia bacterium]|nr:hypothetical protein [Clostridia bacterium]